MKIKDMFVQPIDRNIQGVIKAGERDPDIVRHELEEYVVTGEIRRYISTFFQVFNRSIDEPWDKMGVWISGFFGTGKSHLLKILSYLLEDMDVFGRRPVEYLEEKLDDSFMVAEIRRAAAVPKDVVLFNLDAKADSSSSIAKDTVVGVFTRAFFEQLGFCSSPMWLGYMEWTLLRMGRYEEFCDAFQEVAGAPWVERRELGGIFEESNIVDALVKIGLVEESRKWDFITNLRSSYEMSPETFASMVQEYLDMRGPDHKIIFLADEMGQFIASDTKDMLNLQSVAECLGAECHGRAWIVATSQQAIDEVTKRIVSEDFSKILGRFDTRLSLSSANVDEVIKHRLLRKTVPAQHTLEMFYLQKEAVCRNLFTFSANTPGQRLYDSAKEFSDTYPFVPYQFDLLQSVFEQVRRQGAAGKHLAKGARSMLATIQDAALTIAGDEEGVLIPFSTFYNSMEEFLEPSVREVIEGAKRKPELQSFDSEVLKVLFTLKWTTDVMPATLDNLTVLMASSIDEDKKALRQRIASSLDRLVRQSLVQKDADVFIFLTDDEQDIDREIKRTNYDSSQVARLFHDTIFGLIFETKKVRYQGVYNFDFFQEVDGMVFGSAKAEIGISIMTPFTFVYSNVGYQDVIRKSALHPDRVYMVLSNDRDLVEQAEMYLRLDVFLKQKPRVHVPTNILRILETRETQREKYREEFIGSAKRCIASAEFYVNGSPIDISSRNVKRPQDIIAEAMEKVVPAVYTRIGDMEQHFDDPRELKRLVHAHELGGAELNRRARDEVLQYLSDAQMMHMRVTMKTLVDKYTAKPFGWLLYDLAAVVISLHRENEIELIQGAAKVERGDERIVDMLTKYSQIDKVIVRHRSPDDEELMRLIREIAQQVFNKAHLEGGNQDELIATFKGLLQSELQELEPLASYYRLGRHYPGQASMRSWADILRQILDATTDYARLKQLLKTKGSEIEEGSQSVAPVKSFLENQRVHFDSGVDTLSILREVPREYLSDEARRAMDELQTIVGSEAPYGFIHRIPGLKQTLDGDYARICEAARRDTTKVIDDHLHQVEQALNAAMPDQAQSLDMLNGFQKLKNRASESKRLNDIKALQVTSGEMLQSAFRNIESMTKTTKHESDGQGTAAPTPPVRRHVKLVEVIERVSINETLETVEQVDEFMKSLSSQLKVQIMRGNTVILK
ncbi:MAG: BREX system P-loop protein BrxC [Firmicutes bacterium]|nr:BREX system P-loop protein BrxC [Bacillota bacterium]